MCRINEINILIILSISCNLAKELTEFDALASRPNHCTYEYAFEMYGARCDRLGLRKLPSLRAGIEILDFSDNKLEVLNGDTFSGYSSIKFLYLADNKIYKIEDDAFSSLTGLELLDLSNNVIKKLPNSMFQLPSLRKLILQGNPALTEKIHELKLEKPIRAPLNQLDVSNCELTELPDWGSLPQLKLYNVSHNPLVKLDAGHFAGMCNLGKVDLTESLDTMQLCNIRPTAIWFQMKYIDFQLADFSRLNTKEFQDCPLSSDMEIFNATYNQCKLEILQKQNRRASRRTWLTIGGGLAGFLVGFILVLYIMHRLNVAQTKTTAEKMHQEKAARVGDRHSSAVLLNDVA